jgi:conjugative relaxase-like TrwC/TraI family protein
VLSIGKLGVGQEDYYLSRVASGVEDYYTGAGESAGRWTGAGAARLGLEGEVQGDDLQAVLAGRDPRSGDQLSGRPGTRRVPGWDLTFSAPKSVSVLYGLSGPEVSMEVVRSHEAAVAAGVEYLERHAVVSRRRVDGEVRQVEGHGLVIAAFRHRTSRAGDPQLHTHCLAANLVEHDSGWGAVHSPVIYKHGRTAGFVYQAVLRAELTERLGVAWSPIHNGCAEIEGMDPGLLRAFSKRRTEIEAQMAESGDSSARAAQIATLDTRRAKEYGIEPETLAERWRAEADGHGFRPRHLREVLGHGPPVVTEHHVGVAIEDMVGATGLTQHDASFERRDVTRAWCTALPGGAPVDLDALEELTDVALEDERIVPLLPQPEHEPPRLRRRWSTVDMLATEERLITSSLARRCEGAGLIPREMATAYIDQRPDLTDEQRVMVRELTTSGDGVDLVVGRAGTGKTYALAAAVELWRAAGYTPIGVALAARAAADLEDGANLPSTTVARMLIDCDQASQPLLSDRNVVIVDEAGMVDTRRLERLARRAEEAGAKLVLVGDQHQLPAVEAGGAFAGLVTRLGAVELVENRRQVEQWEQDTLARLRTGAGGRAGMTEIVDDYDRRGRIHVGATSSDVRSTMVVDWYEARRQSEDVAMVALRRSDVRELNARARALLVADGTVASDGVTWAGRTFAVGDEVVCLDNDRRVGLHNALFGRVVGVDADAGLLLQSRSNGKEVAVPSEYLAAGHVDHAYALTIHKAQGTTTDRTLVLADDRLYRQGAYSALSRGRQRNDLYVVASDTDGPAVEERHGEFEQEDASVRLERAFNRDGSKSLAMDEVSPGHSVEL